MLYRVKQFLWALGAKLSDEDKNFIDEYLTSYEKEIFYKLNINEQAHSVRVAKDVLQESRKNGIYDRLVIKAALLHDIGKINSSLNIINKSIITVLGKLFPNKTKLLSRFNCVYVYYNHPLIALSYLDKENQYIKYLISNHHNYDIKRDKKLKMLQDADSRN